MKKLGLAVAALGILAAGSAAAQYSAQNEAKYIATLRSIIKLTIRKISATLKHCARTASLTKSCSECWTSSATSAPKTPKTAGF